MPDQPLKIAFYGYAERDAGSISSAGFVLLEEMLHRGHQIDFFGKRSFAFPEGLDQLPNFSFVQTEAAAERMFGQLATIPFAPLRFAAGRMLNHQTRRNARIAINLSQSTRHYDVIWYHGTEAFGGAGQVPVVSWVQGPPNSDGRSVRRRAVEVRRVEGRARYAAMRTYAWFRDTLGKPNFRMSDVILSGSRYSAGRLKTLAPWARCESLPYPIDLTNFSPEERPTRELAPSRPATILWVGRYVPRKRLDLFLDACAHLIAAGRNINVRIIGRPGFAPGYHQLIENFAYPDRLTYSRSLPRGELPDAYRSAAVLVQPSEEEDFGSAVAEALACGTPVVVGPTNGTADYVQDGGIRFERYDIAAVAGAIAKVLDGLALNPDDWQRRARAAAELNFDVRTIADGLEAILRHPKAAKGLAGLSSESEKI